MLLHVIDRLITLNNLPPTGDIVSIRIVRELRETLSFSEKEIKDLELRQTEDGQQWLWKQAKDKGKEIKTGKRGKEILKESTMVFAKHAHSQGNLTEAFLGVIEKFLTAKELDKVIEEVDAEKAKAEAEAKAKAKEEKDK